MKKLLVVALAVAMAGQTVVAQEKEEKAKNKNRSSNDEIIIKRKEGKDAKVVIELRDNEVLVNGKPIDEYDNEEVTVQRRKSSNYGVYAPASPFRGQGGNWNYNDNEFPGEGAFLGVSTDEAEHGAKVISVTDESAADKAGLEKGDVIMKINDTKIEDPADLTKVIGKMKPEDKVKILYERDGKEKSVSTTLGKRKGMIFRNGFDVNPRLNIEPHIAIPPMEFNFNDGELGQVFAYAGKGRLGIKAQETEDGKGVKVIGVEEGSAAEKAGIRKNDLITKFNGESVNNTEDLAELARDAREKSSINVTINRDGKNETVEIKIPRRLKTSNL